VAGRLTTPVTCGPRCSPAVFCLQLRGAEIGLQLWACRTINHQSTGSQRALHSLPCSRDNAQRSRSPDWLHCLITPRSVTLFGPSASAGPACASKAAFYPQRSTIPWAWTPFKRARPLAAPVASIRQRIRARGSSQSCSRRSTGLSSIIKQSVPSPSPLFFSSCLPLPPSLHRPSPPRRPIDLSPAWVSE
jgi:hypothetical protein